MDNKIVSLIIIFIVTMIFVSTVTYVIFDNNSQDRRIGNEVTLVVSIVIGIFVTVIIQYNQYVNQKRIECRKEEIRKFIFPTLYLIAIVMPLHIEKLLDKWDEFQNNPQKIMDDVDEANRYYFKFKRQLEMHDDLIDVKTYAEFNLDEVEYDELFIQIKRQPSNKNYIEKLIPCYTKCLNLIPTEYHDKRKIQKLKDVLNK